MELIFAVVLYIGVPAVIVLIVARFKKQKFSGGIRAAYTSEIKNTPLYKKLYRQQRVFAYALLCLWVLSALAALVLLSRPAKVETIKQEQSNRDIFLCLDVSSSVHELHSKLITDIKTMVAELEGDRIGITIFNASSITLVPLTDDYEYVLQELDKIEEAVNYFLSLDTFVDGDTTYYLVNNFDKYERYQSYLYSGTDTNENGSSLIGDGLASCVFSFSDLDAARSRCIILCTDNVLAGVPYYTLSQAVDLCASYDIVVYGIAPKEIDDAGAVAISDYEGELRSAVQKTGGNLFIQEEDGAVTGIVDGIKALEGYAIKGPTIIKKTDLPTIPLICFITPFFAVVALDSLHGKGARA